MNNTAQPATLSKLRDRPSSTHHNGQLMVKPAHSGRVSGSARLWQYVQRHKVRSTVTQASDGWGRRRAALNPFRRAPRLRHLERGDPSLTRGAATGPALQCSCNCAGQLARSRPGPSTQSRLDRMGARADWFDGRIKSKTRDPSATARRASQSCPSLTRGAAADRHCSAPAVTVGQLARSRPGPPAQSRLDWMGMDGRRIRSTNRL